MVFWINTAPLRRGKGDPNFPKRLFLLPHLKFRYNEKMRAEIPSFEKLNSRLEHRFSDSELGFTEPATEVSRRRYEVSHNETTQ